MDINALQPLTLPYNNKVMMAPTMEQNREMRAQLFKEEVVKVAQELEEEGKKWSNINKNKKEGLRSIKARIRDGEMVCYVTDKSGRWSCDSLDNY